MLSTVSALSFLGLLSTSEAGASFSQLLPIPTPRRSAAGGVVTNLNDGSPEVWVTGGSTSESDGPVDLVEVYSLSWGDWRQEASMMQPRTHHGAASLDGYLYVGGGITDCNDGEHCQTEKVEKYSSSTKSWSQVSPLSKSRKGVAFASDEENMVLYAVGGMDCKGNCGDLPVEYLSTAEVYDPSSDTWTSLPPMPTPRTDLGLAVVNSKLYAVGGCGGDGSTQDSKNCEPLSVVEVYDPSTKSWETENPLLLPRHGFSLGIYGTQLIAAGGSSAYGLDSASVASNLTKSVDVYDTATGSAWYPIAVMPDPREGLVAGNLLVGISMLLITGESADETLQATNEYLALMCFSEQPENKYNLSDNLKSIVYGSTC